MILFIPEFSTEPWRMDVIHECGQGVPVSPCTQGMIGMKGSIYTLPTEGKPSPEIPSVEKPSMRVAAGYRG